MNEDFVFTKEEKVNKLFKVLNVLKNNLQCKRMVCGWKYGYVYTWFQCGTTRP